MQKNEDAPFDKYASRGNPMTGKGNTAFDSYASIGKENFHAKNIVGDVS